MSNLKAITYLKLKFLTFDVRITSTWFIHLGFQAQHFVFIKRNYVVGIFGLKTLNIDFEI